MSAPASSRRAHPLTVLVYLRKFLFLIIIPVLRGFLGAWRGDFTSWVRGTWIDILILLAMVAVAVMSWLRVGYRMQDGGIRVEAGLIRRRITHIPWDRITTLSVLYSFLLRPFHAVKLRADTLGGSFKDADFAILLHPAQAEEILGKLKDRPARTPTREYTPGTSSILALSLLSSNSFAGIVFIATLISQAGRLLGRDFSNLLIGTVEEAARTLTFGMIPPAAAVIAYLLLAGWFIAFLRTFVRYKNMLVTRCPKTLQISGGAFTKREYVIRRQDIAFLDIRQSLSTRLLGMRTLYLSAVGYGKNKDDISCIIPSERGRHFDATLNRLFPAFLLSPRQLIPPKTGFMRFLGEPLFPCLGIPVAMALCIWRFPAWQSFILFVGLMLMIPSVAFLVVRLLDFLTGGVAFDGTYYTLRYSKGLTLHTVVFSGDKIAVAELRQGFLQRFGGNCDLIIRTRAEGHNLHKCRNLRFDQLSDLFSKDQSIL